MAESKQYAFTFQEIAGILAREQGINSGHWGIYVKFGLGATNLATGDHAMSPTAILPVLELGIREFDEANQLTIDAGEINKEPTDS